MRINNCCLKLLSFGLVLYNQEFGSVFPSISGREHLNPWNFLSDKKDCYLRWAPWTTPEFMLMRWLGAGLLMPQRPTMWVEGWSVEPGDISPTSWQGTGTREWIILHLWWFNQSCLYNKIPTESMNTESHVSFPVWWCTAICLRVMHPEDTETSCLGPC